MKLRIDEVSDRCVYVYRTDTYERYPHTITLTWQELRDKAATSERDSRLAVGDLRCRTSPAESTSEPRKPSGEGGQEARARTQNCATPGDRRSDASEPTAEVFREQSRFYSADPGGESHASQIRVKPVRNSGEEETEHVSAPNRKQEYQRVLGLAEQWLAQLQAETADSKRRIAQALREAP